MPGGPAAGTVLTASGTRRLVTVNLPVASQTIAKQGAAVRIELPGGKSTTGHIASVGTVAVAAKTNSQAQTGESTETATLPVSIILDRAADAGRLDGAPVTVAFTSAEHRGVLAVPVAALLAPADGGVRRRGRRRRRGHPGPVELWHVRRRRVEVTGTGPRARRCRYPAS